jgi:hypothetical protein
MPFSKRLIADSTTTAKAAVITTNCFSDNKFLCSLCMNCHIPKTFFIIYIFILFQISVTTSNHFYAKSGGQNRKAVGEENFKIVGNDRIEETSFLSMQSLHSLSLTSLNQLRMFEERAVPKNVTAQIGHPVYLHCIVEPIGDKMVSWIRLRDFHLLTVGLLTYISDDRFVIRHGTLKSNDWALQIKHVTPKDEGLYECQINSDPPRSQYYYLHIVVPVAEMVGYPDMFVRTGATINLTCIISRSPEPPAFVFWYHNDRMINYDYNSIGRGQISVHKDSSKSDLVISRLVIRGAKLHDTGNYTCTPSNVQEPPSIYVHVLQGEKRLSSRIQNDESSIEQNSNSRSFDTSMHTLSSTNVIHLIMVAVLSIFT